MGCRVSRLTDIPVRVEPWVRVAGLGGGVTALLNELAGLLERLSSDDRSAVIDLRSLPMSADDKLTLQRFLGEGEVCATVQADGLSNVRETRISGVWWIEHRDREGELIAELLEVCTVPRFLAAGLDDVAAGASELRTRLAGGAPIPS
jgi:hypothetical protein